LEKLLTAQKPLKPKDPLHLRAPEKAKETKSKNVDPTYVVDRVMLGIKKDKNKKDKKDKKRQKRR